MKTFNNSLRTLLFVLGAGVALMALLPVLTFDDLSYTGYEVAFGMELLNINPFNLGSIASAHLPFSLAALLAFTLPFVAGVIALANKRLALVSLVILITALVLMVRLPESVEILTIIGGTETTVSVDWALGHGLIAATVLTVTAIVAGGVLVFSEHSNA